VAPPHGCDVATCCRWRAAVLAVSSLWAFAASWAWHRTSSCRWISSKLRPPDADALLQGAVADAARRSAASFSLPDETGSASDSRRGSCCATTTCVSACEPWGATPGRLDDGSPRSSDSAAPAPIRDTASLAFAFAAGTRLFLSTVSHSPDVLSPAPSARAPGTSLPRAAARWEAFRSADPAGPEALPSGSCAAGEADGAAVDSSIPFRRRVASSKDAGSPAPRSRCRF
jgi:hypothetical protein